MSDKDEYVEEIRVVRRKKDTYRSNSSKTDEFESDLLRSKSTRSVAGPTESRAVDEEEMRHRFGTNSTSDAAARPLTPGQQALADGLAELADVVIRELVVPLVRDVAAPAARAKWAEFTERRRTRAQERLEAKARAERTARLEVVEEAGPATPGSEVEASEPPIAMSRSDMLLARLQLQLAEDFVARQRWLLEHAEIADEDLTPTLEHSIMRMLEGRADELTEPEREEVAIFLRHAGVRTKHGAIGDRPQPAFGEDPAQ
ncbi:hypothetical protein [Microbacterium testaceum]|uniref:hypothetical protein n=1 Tax=Microbacterium testaceum TaxID=2033 RepID=UPI0012AC93D7|nr:hypothetical protein [Microbacterium testaceum]